LEQVCGDVYVIILDATTTIMFRALLKCWVYVYLSAIKYFSCSVEMPGSLTHKISPGVRLPGLETDPGLYPM
jgi:hypothetical protein